MPAPKVDRPPEWLAAIPRSPSGHPDGGALVRSIWTTEWRPRQRLTVDQWADQNRWLSEQAGASSGRWSTDFTPYTREPMRCFTDPSVSTITLMWASQSGKTSVVENCLFFAIDTAPGPTMIVFPSQDLAQDHNRDRLIPSMRASPAVARHLTGKKWDVKARKLILDRMIVFFAGANSEGNLSSKSIRYLFPDEIDAYDTPAALDRAMKRVRRFLNHKIVQTSTPSFEDVGIHQQYLRGDRRQYYVPCPHCGRWQTLVFANVRCDPPPDRPGAQFVDLDPDWVERRSYYECALCGRQIHDRHKPDMLRRGAWLKEGQRPSVASDGSLVVEGRGRETKHASFHLSALYIPWSSFGRVARAFVESKGEPTREWINHELAEPWREKAIRADVADIIALAKAPPSYRRGHAPPGSIVLTGGIDVQSTSVYYSILAWGWQPESRTDWCALVDYGVIECPEVPVPAGVDDAELLSPEQVEQRSALVRDAWSLVSASIAATYPVLSPDGAAERYTRVFRWVIDQGYRSDEVLSFCEQRYPEVTPVKGEETVPGGLPHDESPIPRGSLVLAHAQGRRRAVIESSSTVWRLRVPSGYWVENLFSRMRRQLPTPSAFLWPDDLDESFARQVTSMENVRQITARGVKSVWRLRRGRQDNHYLDTLVYQFAFFDRYLRSGMAEQHARYIRDPAAAPATVPGTIRQSPGTPVHAPGTPGSAGVRQAPPSRLPGF